MKFRWNCKDDKTGFVIIWGRKYFFDKCRSIDIILYDVDCENVHPKSFVSGFIFFPYFHFLNKDANQYVINNWLNFFGVASNLHDLLSWLGCCVMVSIMMLWSQICTNFMHASYALHKWCIICLINWYQIDLFKPMIIWRSISPFFCKKDKMINALEN